MRWLISRLGQSVPLLLGLITLLFGIIHLLGDPARMIAGQRSDVSTLASVRKKFRLDLPIWKQYCWYLNDLSPIGFLESGRDSSTLIFSLAQTPGGVWALKKPDLGNSFQNNRAVSEMIAEKLPGTLMLAVAAMTLAVLLGITGGILAAVFQHRWPDRLLTVVAALGISAPSFVVAVALVWVLAVLAGDWTGLPVSGYIRSEDTFSDALRWRPETLVLPALALGIRPLSLILQLTRNSLLEVLGQDFIRTARAKGLGERTILLKHALRNALNPVNTAVSGWFASLLAGVFFIEYMFDWQGLGKLTLDALSKNDYPVLSGCVLFTGFVFILMNLLADALYAVADPRIRLKT